MLQLNKFFNFESQLPPRNVWYVWPRPSALHIYNILLLILRFDVLLASFEQDLYLSIFCILLFSWDHFHQPQNQSHDKYFLCWLKTTQKYCSHKTLIETIISFENDPRLFRILSLWAIIWVQKWARECAWLCTRPSLSRCWVPAPPPAPGDRVPLPPSGRADIPPPSCGRQGPLPAPHPTHVLPRPPRSYPPPHPHTLTPCAHLVGGWGGEA